MASNQPIMPKINSPLGILRTSQAVASDITINIILYALIYSIIYLFRLRNLFLQFNHYFITIILFILEIFWIILYIIIRLIYLVYNTINDSKINDYRYNTHGILRTFIIHNQFWKFENNLVMNSIFKHGPNVFLDIQDDLIIPNLINKGNDIIIPIDNNDNINDIDIDHDNDDNDNDDESSLTSNISNSTRIKTKSNFTKWARHSQFASTPPPLLSSSNSAGSLNKLKSKIYPKN